MKGLLNPDGKFFAFCGWLWNLFYLNLLTLLCSLPVFTLGASITAMQYTLYKLKLDEGPGVSACFFRSFRENFKQSSLLTLFLLAAIYLMWIDKQIIDIYGGMAFKMLFIIVAVLITEIFAWSTALLARYQNTFWHTLGNAGKMCIAKPLRSLEMAVLTALPFLLPFIDIALLLPVLLIGTSLCGWLRVFVYAPVFRAYEESQDAADRKSEKEADGTDAQ